MIEGDDHALWLSMACGIVRIAGSDLDAWTRDSSRRVNVLVLDESDGAVNHEHSGGAMPNRGENGRWKTVVRGFWTA